MAIKIGTITLDGTFTDWPAADMIMTAANTVAGYQVYGALIDDAMLGENYVIGIDATASTDPAIAAGTVIYLNTDQNDTTGYSPFGAVGAEYEVQFALDSTGALQAYLYSVTSAGVTTLLNGGAPLDSGFSSNGQSVELAIPQSLLTPAGGTAPTAIDFDVLINNATALPAISAPPRRNTSSPMPRRPRRQRRSRTRSRSTARSRIGRRATSVMTPGNTVAGYQVYGAFLRCDARQHLRDRHRRDRTTDPVIGAGTTIYLNTDQNTATGYSPFGNIGAEYEVQFAYGSEQRA